MKSPPIAATIDVVNLIPRPDSPQFNSVRVFLILLYSERVFPVIIIEFSFSMIVGPNCLTIDLI